MHHYNLAALSGLIAASSTTSKTSTSAGGSSYTLLIILVVIVGAYFLFLRPRQRKARQQQVQAKKFTIGDEVISAGGIMGTVIDIRGDEVEVEVSPSTTLNFWSRAISLRSSVRGAPQPPDSGTEPEQDMSRGYHGPEMEDEAPAEDPGEDDTIPHFGESTAPSGDEQVTSWGQPVGPGSVEPSSSEPSSSEPSSPSSGFAGEGFPGEGFPGDQPAAETSGSEREEGSQAGQHTTDHIEPPEGHATGVA